MKNFLVGIFLGTVVYSGTVAFFQRNPDTQVLWQHHAGISVLVLILLLLYLLNQQRLNSFNMYAKKHGKDRFGNPDKHSMPDRNHDHRFRRDSDDVDCRHRRKQAVAYCPDCHEEFYVDTEELRPVESKVVSTTKYGRR